jgi:hypothetical protein
VHHLPVFQVDEAAIGVARQRELAGFSRNTDELDDVGQRQFFERSLECHVGFRATGGSRRICRYGCAGVTEA